MTQRLLADFCHQYSLSKTLRFALRPVGETEQFIANKGLLEEDEERVEKYKQAKKIIDEYHKDFINRSLEGFCFEEKDLENFHEAYYTFKNSDNKDSQDFEGKQTKLREAIGKQFNTQRLFTKHFIKETLPEWLKERTLQIEGVDDPGAIIKDFEDWTTYFRGFNENRKNIYKEEKGPRSTSIGYRLIHENLPRFIDNIKRYKDARELNVDFSDVERIFDVDLDQVFSLEYYNHCLTQRGIDTYNQILGGQSEQGNVKKQGVNEKINLHAQQLKSEGSNATDERKKELEEKAKKVRSCKLEKLHKQILSDRSELSFRLEEIDSDASLCAAILLKFKIDDAENLIGKDKDINITENLEKSLTPLKDADPEKIYVNNRSIAAISQNLFKNWNTINDCLEYYAEKKLYPVPEREKETKKLLDQREQWCKQSYFSFTDIHKALETYFEQYTGDELKDEQKSEGVNDGLNIKEQKEIAESRPLFVYFERLAIRKKNQENNTFESKHLLEEIQRTFKEALPVLEEYECIEEEKLKNEKDKVQKIKHYLDALMDLQYFLKSLSVQLSKKEEEKAVELYEKDTGFYEGFDALFEVVEQIVPLYNKTRNYLTKKPYSVEKYKLNFENQELADGWDKNKEKANTCVLLMKDGQYFLGIMDREHKKIFEGGLPDEGQCYRKIVYKQIANAGKDIQNLIRINGKFERKTKKLDELKKQYIPDIYEIRKRESHKTTNKNFNKADLIKFIDYYKEAAIAYWDWYDFSFKKSNKYDSFKEFTDHVNSQGYKIKFQDVSETHIDDCVKKGKLYLFQIYSKDFSPKTRGKPNLQTLYWKALFDDKNLRDVVYKLNGKAELFYRNPSIEYSPSIWEKGHHAGKIRQTYPIIKDHRYAKATYLFHVSIQCNFKAGTKNSTDFNREVRDSLKDNSEVNIIGLIAARDIWLITR